MSEIIEKVIFTLLDKRAVGASLCPSEVARSAELMRDADQWRELMPKVRACAYKLHKEGRVEICQRGVVVEPSSVKGPIRIRYPIS